MECIWFRIENRNTGPLHHYIFCWVVFSFFHSWHIAETDATWTTYKPSSQWPCLCFVKLRSCSYRALLLFTTSESLFHCSSHVCAYTWANISSWSQTKGSCVTSLLVSISILARSPSMPYIIWNVSLAFSHKIVVLLLLKSGRFAAGQCRLSDMMTVVFLIGQSRHFFRLCKLFFILLF